jgi:oxygen-dependent protoporphyrinogen oxidase
MKDGTEKIVILGAGISGLSAAYGLNRDGVEITILESGSEPGGSMITRREDGYLIDFGPNSGLETTPLIGQLVEEVGLEDEFIYAQEESNNRYILRNDRLYPLPMSPIAFLRTRLFSKRAKLRLLAEPMIGRSEDGYYQSVSQFVERRLGREFLDYAINPFVAGVFAGSPDRLSVKSAFPKLYRLEEVYGGLLKGLVKGAKERKKRAEHSKHTARLFSFKSGMQTLPKAIARVLRERIMYNCSVEKVLKGKRRLEVLYRHNGRSRKMVADTVLSAIPAYEASSVFKELDGLLADHLERIYYPPVKVLFLGFAKEMIGRLLDGFGFLIPEKEKKTFLGSIWSSSIFPGRSDEDLAAFTLFVGGARSAELFDMPDARIFDSVLKEFKEIMSIKANPLFVKEKMWPRAIPQYDVGYIEHERYFERFETENPGVFLSGNYRGGISVGDCIRNSELTCKRINAYLLQKQSIQQRKECKC